MILTKEPTVDDSENYAFGMGSLLHKPRFKSGIVMRILDIAVLLLLAALWGGSFLFMRMTAPITQVAKLSLALIYMIILYGG